jgi:hypothetical protein
MARTTDNDPQDQERPEDERGAHNRLGFLDVDEGDSSSERGGEEPDVEAEIEQRE